MAARRSVAAARSRISREHAAFAGIFVVTMLGLISVGAVLPVLPRYVKGPIGAGDIAVGVVVGAFAFTGVASRPIAGRLADHWGRRPTVVGGALVIVLAGALIFVPAGVAGLLVARLVLGVGEGTVFTAGSAWVVDLTPPRRRGRVIGLYGLSIWGGLSAGPAIGELLLHLGSYELVWAFATAAPLLGALIATRLPDAYVPARRGDGRPRPLLAREALGPGAAFAAATAGYATVAAFIVLHLDANGVGHGGAVFTVFAVTVVLTRLIAGGLPDRLGSIPIVIGGSIAEAASLVLLGVAHSLALALAGALVMGIAFSLLYPSLSLLVLSRIPEDRRGAAFGTFTGFFDIGFGLGAPLAGLAVTLGGYGAGFGLAAAVALMPALAFGSRALRAGAALGQTGAPARTGLD